MLGRRPTVQTLDLAGNGAMADSYDLFLREFGITEEALVAFGLRETVFPDAVLARLEWERQKQSVLAGEVQFIRAAGRNGSGTALYVVFYGKFLNLPIRADPTNNSLPKRILESTSRDAGRLVNYQVAHVSGRTKNPLLFAAPWNVVWKPKILDPFTGHEAAGEIAGHYRSNFEDHARLRLAEFIEDYERFRADNICLRRADLVLDQMRREGCFPTPHAADAFARSIRYQLGPLV